MVNYLMKTCHYVRKLHLSGNYYKHNYYDILKIDRNSTQKEIKSAYLKRSKELHPDKNPNDPQSKAKFILISEAYNVLSRPYVRKLYDRSLDNSSSKSFEKNAQKNSTCHEETWSDEHIWEMRDKSRDKFYENKPYYGIKGMKRVSNRTVAFACFIFMIFGMIGHYLAFKYGRGSSLEIMDEKNRKVLNTYMEIRRQVQHLDKEGQIQRMKEKCAKDGNTRDDE